MVFTLQIFHTFIFAVVFFTDPITVVQGSTLSALFLSYRTASLTYIGNIVNGLTGSGNIDEK